MHLKLAKFVRKQILVFTSLQWLGAVQSSAAQLKCFPSTVNLHNTVTGQVLTQWLPPLMHMCLRYNRRDYFEVVFIC
jgi:hypothetical protein